MTARLREAALWAGAALGLLSVVAGVAVMFFGYSFLIFRSGSMGPDIPTGSLALARTTPVAELEPGDVVSVLSINGARVTHRLVSATIRGDEGSLILQGDANGAPDQEIYQATEVEVEIASVPYLGYVVTVLLSPAGLVGAGCLSGMLLLAGWGSGEPRESRVVTGAGPGGRHRRARGRAVRRSHAVAGATAAAALVVAGSATAGTSAFFTDRATVPGQYSSATMTAPVNAQCVDGGLFGANSSFTWSAPASPARISGYVVSWTRTSPAGSGSETLAANVMSWRPATAGTYSVRVRATTGGWTSPDSPSDTLVAGSFLGIATYSC